MAEASSSAAAAAAPPPPKAKWGDDSAATPDVSDAIAGLTQQMAEAEPAEVEVDEPDHLKVPAVLQMLLQPELLPYD